MGAPHGHLLHYHGHSPLHRAPAHAKILALVVFMLLVVATPRQWSVALVVPAAVLAAAIGVSGVPVRYLLRRAWIEAPFVVFALSLPFVATGPRTEVLGLELSEPGLAAGATLLAKGTLGVFAGLLLASTTEPHAVVAGLARLRVPTPLVEITGFMVRYLDVVADEMRRMRTAREARGFTARNPAHWPVLARSVGALFIRSYERGERVHLAMLARGYDGGARP